MLHALWGRVGLCPRFSYILPPDGVFRDFVRLKVLTVSGCIWWDGRLSFGGTMAIFINIDRDRVFALHLQLCWWD